MVLYGPTVGKETPGKSRGKREARKVEGGVTDSQREGGGNSLVKFDAPKFEFEVWGKGKKIHPVTTVKKRTKSGRMGT